jgi:preprotein translocase subunit SecE
MAQSKIIAFFQETRQEIAKVTWPTQRETVMTTIMIVAMAVIAGIFFLAVDSVLGFGIEKILGMK